MTEINLQCFNTLCPTPYISDALQWSDSQVMVWAHKPGVTHLSLIYSPGPAMVLCALSVAHYTFTN